MISLDEVERTILDLEQKDTSYAVCERLAWLYIVKDHIQPKTRMNEIEKDIAPISYESEFLATVSGKDMEQVLSVLDKHMECVKLIYPSEYAEIIRMISEL